MTDIERLHAAVQLVIDKQGSADEVSPASIATEVMRAIEFPPELHELGYVGCHLEVRQIARQKLRRQHDPNARVAGSIAGEDELFPDTLQERYPRRPRPNEDPVYAKRDALTDEDVAYNVGRMRRGARALLKHADALEAWHVDRGSMAA